MAKERTFQASGVRVNYLDYGSAAADPIVLLHGGAWRWQEYLSLIPSLGRRWYPYALDLRGNGRSQWTPDAYRLQDFVQDSLEFVGQLAKPAVLVGHSIGGVIALMVASRCRNNIKAVVVEDPPLSLENYRNGIEANRAMYAQWLDLKKSAQTEQDLALRLGAAYLGYPGVTSAWLMFFAGCLWQLDPTYFNVLLRDFDTFAEGYDSREILAGIDRPLLFLTGERRLGSVMTDDEIVWLQRNCDNVTCQKIEGVGQLLHLEDHGQAPVLTEMLAFLDCVCGMSAETTHLNEGQR